MLGFAGIPGLAASPLIACLPSCPTGIQPGAWKGNSHASGYGELVKWVVFLFFPSEKWAHPRGNFSSESWMCLEHRSCRAAMCTKPQLGLAQKWLYWLLGLLE